jgi:hypothetical protein
MDPKAIDSLRKVLTLRTRRAEAAKEICIVKPVISSFQREKKFLTYLVGSFDVRRASYSRLVNAIHSAISPKEPFGVIPTHDRYEFEGVVVWVNTNSLESLDCYDRLMSCIASVCEKANIPYIIDAEKIKDYDVCTSPL